MIRGIVVAAFIASLLSFAPSPALAHSQLKKSVPAADATVAAGLTEIRLQFNEVVEPRISKVTVDLKGKPVASEPAASDPNDKTTLVVRFAQPLQAGSYKVNWQAVSADTHKVKGSFSFQVAP